MRWLKKKNIATQLIIMLVISVTLLTVLFANVLYGMNKKVRTTEKEYVNSTAQQLAQHIEQNYMTFTKIMKLVSFNRDVQAFLMSENYSEKVVQYVHIKNLMSDISDLNENILDIVIVDKNGISYAMGGNILYELQEPDPEDVSARIGSPQSVFYYGEDVSYITIAQNIYSIDSYTQINSMIGTLHFVLKEDALTGGEYPVNISEGTTIQLVDKAGNQLWENQNTKGNDKKNCIEQKVDLNIDGLSIKIYHRKQEIVLMLKQWGEHLSLVYPILFIFLIFLWGSWSQSLIKPMYELTRFMEKIGEDDVYSLKSRIHLKGYQEIEMVGNQINSMLEKIDELSEMNMKKNRAIYQEQVYAKQLEISFLRNQINPHFLYNTLETMCGIAYSENQPRMAEIAKALGLIFKYSIKGKDFVPLRDELKIVKNYILIQSIRFADRFVTEYEIEDDFMMKMVPKMIFQPLIENAIVHGIEGCDRLCHLQLKVTVKDDALLLSVNDDGIGIPPDELEEIQKQLEKNSQFEIGKEVQHIGILNVHSRIRLHFGEPYGVQIESKEGKGTRVSILLPLQENEII